MTFFIKVIKTIEFSYIKYELGRVNVFICMRVVGFLDVHGKRRE